MAGLPPRGRAVHRRADAAAAREGRDRGRRTAASHDHRLRRVQPQVDARRHCDSVRGQGSALETPCLRRQMPERLPFVGEDGTVPAMSTSPGWWSGAAGVHTKLHRRQRLAYRGATARALRPRRRRRRDLGSTRRDAIAHVRPMDARDVHVNPIGESMKSGARTPQVLTPSS